MVLHGVEVDAVAEGAPREVSDAAVGSGGVDEELQSRRGGVPAIGWSEGVAA